MTAGLLVLDVDGVLNPWQAKLTRRPEGYESYRLTKTDRWYSERASVRRYKGMLVRLHPGHGALLTRLAEQTGLELVWGTTWGESANQRIAPAIGLPELPVIPFDDELDFEGALAYWRPGGSWKYPAVARYAAGRPLAWFDDEFGSSRHSAARAAFERERGTAPTLLHSVDPVRGLTGADLEAVRVWAGNDHRDTAE
jgi:hypothetical protein